MTILMVMTSHDKLGDSGLGANAPARRYIREWFDGVFYAGGHGQLWDLAEDAQSIALIESMLAAGKPIAAAARLLNQIKDK